MEKLCFLLENFFNDLSSLILTTFAVGLMLLYVLVSFLVSLFKVEYSNKKRLFFIPFWLGVCLLHLGYEVIYGQIGFVIITFGAGITLFPFTFIVTKKQKKASKEQLELARYIDQQVKNSKMDFDNAFSQQEDSITYKKDDVDCVNNLPNNNVAKQILKAVTQVEKPSSPDTPDFTHVKNVIERLNYFPLTPSDKKQVNELQITIERAELGEEFPDLKNKINDGLSSLLKIMSKYGV